MKTFVIVAAAICFSAASAADAGPFMAGRPALRPLAEQTHWIRKGWTGFSGPPYGIQYSRAYGYAFDSSYYESGYAGCVGIQHMCASRWGWGGRAYRRCLANHRWC